MLAIHKPPKGGIPNGEEGKGREEEGCEEEIAERKFATRGGVVCAPFLVSALRHSIPDPHAPDDIPLLNSIDHVHAVDDVPEHRIAAVEMRLR